MILGMVGFSPPPLSQFPRHLLKQGPFFDLVLDDISRPDVMSSGLHSTFLCLVVVAFPIPSLLRQLGFCWVILYPQTPLVCAVPRYSRLKTGN